MTFFFGGTRGEELEPYTPTVGFPESFSRTAPPEQEEEDKNSDDMSDSTSHSDITSLNFPRGLSLDVEEENVAPRRVLRSSVMRLENILNDVSIGPNPHPRSRSLGRSPSTTPSHFEAYGSPPHLSNFVTRSQSPDESVVKKKKVKMHRCPECQKDFPRPSGLRTHMNMHTKEKPFNCNYPGCVRTFSVVSNAKRHMRTHGIGIIPDDSETASTPYIVGFEVPVVVSSPETGDRNSPVRLRWISSAPEGRRASVDGSYSGAVLDFSESEIPDNPSLAVEQP